MPNQKSKAGHIPMRTCVICRQKKPQLQLLRFGKTASGVVYDLKHKLSGRGFYVCISNKCLQKIEQWQRKKKKWKKS
ncbi:MAG: uncharacterized protein PWQ09_848 [Candidatus Cloacimonadota bacterium]|jgi:hypothetical protein|nr:uncharacterized protein [Candidatus Cloacimonadota bacterium]